MHPDWASKNVFNRRNNSWKSWPDKGIVAGLIDEIGIVELINQKLGVDNREKIATGQVQDLRKGTTCSVNIWIYCQKYYLGTNNNTYIPHIKM